MKHLFLIGVVCGICAFIAGYMTAVLIEMIITSHMIP